MKPIWIILITVVATALVVGAGTYYYLHPKYEKDRNSLQMQIDDLNQKVSDTTDDAGVVDDEDNTPVTVADPTENWNKYSDNTYSLSFKYPKDWTSLKVEKITPEAEGPYWEVISNNINIPDNTNAHLIRLISISNLSDYSADYKSSVDAIKKVYTSKSAAGAGAIMLPPVNAATTAYSTPVYLESTDQSYRGIYYFANIGQDRGLSLDFVAVLTNNTNVVTLHVSRTTDKTGTYSADTDAGFELYKNYVKTVTAASTETLATEFNNIYKPLVNSLKAL